MGLSKAIDEVNKLLETGPQALGSIPTPKASGEKSSLAGTILKSTLIHPHPTPLQLPQSLTPSLPPHLLTTIWPYLHPPHDTKLRILIVFVGIVALKLAETSVLARSEEQYAAAAAATTPGQIESLYTANDAVLATGYISTTATTSMSNDAWAAVVEGVQALAVEVDDGHDSERIKNKSDALRWLEKSAKSAGCDFACPKEAYGDVGIAKEAVATVRRLLVG